MTTAQKLGIGALVAGGLIGLLYLTTKAAAVAFVPWVYDANGDCYIDSAEAMVAVHDWQFGPLTEAQAAEVVSLWLNSIRNPKC